MPPPLRQTYTFVTLEVSNATYDEIAQKLKDADYQHVFTSIEDKGIAIDMHGIALTRKDAAK